MSVIGGNYEAGTAFVAGQALDVTMPGTLVVAASSTNTQAFTIPASLVPLFDNGLPIAVACSDSAAALSGQQSWQGAAYLNGCSIKDISVSGSTLTVTFSNNTLSSITIPATLRLIFFMLVGS